MMEWPTGRKSLDPESAFSRLSPWLTRFVIDGKVYGGEISFERDSRIPLFFEAFPGIITILDLGSLEGGQTFRLAGHPGVRVLGIEGRRENIRRAKFAQKMLRISNVRFVQADLEKASLRKYGVFDAVFCCGILYHLPEPRGLIERLRQVSSRLFIWTHYASEEKATVMVNGFKGCWYREGGKKEPLSGLSLRSFWPSLPSLQAMLMQSGFTQLKILEDKPDHPHGNAVTITAEAPAVTV
jgi:hypothetical protein